MGKKLVILYRLPCRIVGVVTIFTGLYLVLWGKRRDQPASQSNTDSAARSEQQMNTPGECLGSTSDHAAINHLRSVVRTDETV